MKIAMIMEILIEQWRTVFLILTMFTVSGDEDERDPIDFTYVEQGGSVEIKCTFSISETINSLQWKHQVYQNSEEKPIGEPVSGFAENHNNVSKQPNYQVISTYKIQSFKLKLANMNPYMNGHYKCYVNNASKYEHKVYMKGSCDFTKCTKSVKGKNMILNISTPSVYLGSDFAGLDVRVNGTKIYCSINLSELKTSKCELVPDPPPPYVIIVTDGKEYYTSDVYVTLEQSSHCPQAGKEIKRICKAEDKGQPPGQPSSSCSKEPVTIGEALSSSKKPVRTSQPFNKESVFTKPPSPFTSIQKVSSTRYTTPETQNRPPQTNAKTTPSTEQINPSQSLKPTTPTNLPSRNSEKNESVSKVPIILGAVFGAVFIVLIVIFVVCYKNYNKKENARKSRSSANDGDIMEMN